jgi:para-nitrobenzyl esterase
MPRTRPHHLTSARLLALTLSLSAWSGAAPDPAPDPGQPLGQTVTTRSGPVVGSPADAAGILSFKGVPYAAAPVGPLRWKEPQAAEPWSAPRDAKRFGAQCWAATAFGGPVVTANKSEDCLNLNVWSGAPTTNSKLPVMVWIHGGGFQFASGSDPEYDGSSLARQGVVVVTLNYRLGVFGFLSRPDLDGESAGHASGMYGLHDQIAALSWVGNNIAAFGGDPANVTVFGESAGAHAIGILMASPLADGLFHKAIGQSGAFWESEMRERQDALAIGVGLGEQLGARTLEQLRAVSALDLQTATDWTFAGSTRFSPTVDGYLLTERPYLRFSKGQQHDVPLLVGWNADEALPFLPFSLPHDSPQALTGAAEQLVGSANLAAFLKVYPAGSTPEATRSALNLVGDQTIKAETWSWAGQQHKTGRSPVFVYNFGFTSPHTPVATHLTEVGYVFGTLRPGFGHPAPAADADRAVSETIQRYWSNFARSGNPNGANSTGTDSTGRALPVWPTYAGAGGQALQIGTTIQAGPEEGTARYQFLERFRVQGVPTIGHH